MLDEIPKEPIPPKMTRVTTYVRESVKIKLREEASKRRLKISAMTARILEKALEQ